MAARSTLLTAREAAEQLGIHIVSLHRLCTGRTDRVPTIRSCFYGNQRMIEQSEIDRYLADPVAQARRRSQHDSKSTRKAKTTVNEPTGHENGHFSQAPAPTQTPPLKIPATPGIDLTLQHTGAGTTRITVENGENGVPIISDPGLSEASSEPVFPVESSLYVEHGDLLVDPSTGHAVPISAETAMLRRKLKAGEISIRDYVLLRKGIHDTQKSPVEQIGFRKLGALDPEAIHAAFIEDEIALDRHDGELARECGL